MYLCKGTSDSTVIKMLALLKTDSGTVLNISYGSIRSDP